MDPGIARILDANYNRAREAMRVMEDYARFVLDDPAGCETIKRLRHALADCVCALPAAAMLESRDTTADVGTSITTDSEGHRTDAQSVFTAAARRLPEALRTLEEYAKTFNAKAARGFEALRYRAYEAESQLTLRSRRASQFGHVRLYVLVTATLCCEDWLKTVSQAVAGGAGCVQLREKQMEDNLLLERATALVALCREHGVLSIINDRPDIARLSDADGVHLGQSDLPVREARKILGPDRLVGLSTHTSDQVEKAIEAEPDYLAVGPMYPSPTKPQAHVPGPALLSLAMSRTQRPVVAIGGITPDRIPALAQAGARCICACSAVIAAEDATAAARQLTPPAPTSEATTE